MKNPAAIAWIVEDLVHSDLRPDIILALEELGDAAAIIHLTPLLLDTTDAWAEDNHAPVSRVCDLAQTAITRLNNAASLREQFDSHSPINQAPIGGLIAKPAAYGPTTTQQPGKRSTPGFNLLPYVPLAAAIVNVAWFAGLMFIWICNGQRSFSFAEELLCALPAIAGLLIGITLIATRITQRAVDLIFIYLGSVCCAIIVFSFTWEAFHPA